MEKYFNQCVLLYKGKNMIQELQMDEIQSNSNEILEEYLTGV